ncbi:MAG: HAD hydrolase-like protein [Anaerolineae bacterium]|nr:HAD hydrolase-like protein [Anaerolineae bacterium]
MSFLPHTHIELVNPEIQRGQVRSVLFDFDGTLSLIREGWQVIMIPMMVEILLDLGSGESEAALTTLVTEFVDRLTGKQTIYQMLELCSQIERRGGRPLDALEYKRMYLDRLWQRIAHRVEGLKAGRVAPVEMVVPGTFDILENLKQRGIALYLASGTDQPYVLDEAAALGLVPYFNEHIFGALDEYKRFSKAIIIQTILRDHGLGGEHLLTLGDGFVEIEETKRVGGIAVGVASDEVNRRGINEWKRGRLIEAGADIVIPDFREQDELITYLFDE